MDLANQILRSEDCGQSIQCIRYSDEGFLVYQGPPYPLFSYSRNDFLIFSTFIHLQMRFLRDLICLLQQCFSNQCSSVSNQLLTLIIDCISLMLRLDTTALISLYQNDFISVLSGCLQYFPSGLSLTSIIDHLLGLVSVVSFFLLQLHTLLQVDHSTNHIIIRKLLSNVLLQPSLFHKASYEQCVYLHDQLLHQINSIDLVCSSVSLQVIFVRLIHFSNILTVSFRALSLISLLQNRFLNITYLRLVSLLNFNPLSMNPSRFLSSLPIHSFSPRLLFVFSFIRRTFQRVCLKVFSSGIPKKKLSHECTDNRIGSFIHHLLKHIQNQESLSKQVETGYSNLQEGDNPVSSVLSYEPQYTLAIEGIYFASYVLFSILSVHRKTSLPEVEYRYYSYDFWYSCLSRLDDMNYESLSPSSRNTFIQLASLYEAWLWNGQVDQTGLSFDKILHPKCLPHYLLCLRYTYEQRL